jgi:hypothetical protein
LKEEAKILIDKLKLSAHPEGGYFKEVYRSSDIIEKEFLPPRYKSPHCVSTSIYYMLVENQISHFHKLLSDEIWHFYTGSPILIHCISTDGDYTCIKLGSSLNDKFLFQHTIKLDTWFAAELEDKNSFALVGCTVAPGFDFEDFLLADRKKLMEQFPAHKEVIERFTKE